MSANVFVGRLRRAAGPWVVVAVFILAYAGVILALNAGDPLAFAKIGTRFSRGDPNGSEGYDGQFAYQIAINPLGAAPYIDVPAYRYQRILYPMLAWLLALGQPALVPWALILINIVALVAGTRLTEGLLQRYGASRWYALAYGLYAGQVLAVRLDVSEPLSQALLMLGIAGGERRRWAWAAVAFALAALAKETALVTVAGYLLFLLLRRQWRNLLLVGVASALPFAALQIWLKLWLGQWGVGSGGAGATAFTLVPFGGILEIARYGWKPLALWLVILGPLLVAPIVAATVAGVRALLRRPLHPFAMVLLAQCAMLIFLPFSTWREMLAMLRLSVGFVAAVLLFSAWAGSRRGLLYAQLWIAALVFLLKE